MSEPTDIISYMERAVPVGSQAVAPEDARRIAIAEQQRHTVARIARATLAPLRVAVNQLDHAIVEPAEDLRKAIVDRAEPHHEPMVSRKWHLIGVLAIILADVPINKAALDVLGQDDTTSTLMAAIFGVSTVFVAECTARTFRMAVRDRKPWAEWCFTGAANAILLSATVGVAYLRSIAPKPAVDAAAATAGVVPTVAGSGWIIGALQLMFYFAAVLLAFHQSDPSHKAEQSRKRIVDRRKKLDAIWRKRVPLAKKHNATIEHARTRIIEIEYDCIERICEYRGSNMQRGNVPTFVRRSVSRSVFEPIDLGQLIDEHPAAIMQILNQAEAG